MPEMKELKTRAWQAHKLMMPQLLRQLWRGSLDRECTGHSNPGWLQRPQEIWPSLHEKDSLHLRYTLK